MIYNQALLFLIFIVNGIFIGMLFDIFRILRKSFKTKDLITYIEDLLFWILTGIIILYSIFTFNNGEIRLYMILAIILGTIFYMIIFSKYIIKTNIFIILYLKKTFKILFNFLNIPIHYIYIIIRKLILNPFLFLFINLRKYSTNFYKNKSKITNKIKNKEGF